MPVLKDRLHHIASEQQAVEAKVAHENFRPTETEAEVIQRITQTVSAKYRDEISRYGFVEDVKRRICETIAAEAAAEGLSFEQQKRIEHITTVNVVGLGPLETFMQDNEVTEIIVQRWDNICIEKRGLIEHVEASFNDEEHLRTVINRIVQPVGRQINLNTPMVDARLADGSRVNATIPPASPDGATLCIRKFSDHALTGADYINLGSLDLAMLKFLARCVEGKVSMIVSGGTSTGKTTLLNMLSGFIPPSELIITIEDSCELRLNQPNVRRLESRAVTGEGMMPINTQTLVKNSLRMRPDRIVVGEIRDGTIVDMMSAMSTGHEGSLSTVHANSPTNLMNSRMPILYSMNESVSFTEESQNIQIAEALQLVVHISRLRSGARKITHITHVVGTMDDGRVKLKDIFLYNEETDRFEATGYVPKDIIRHAKSHGVVIPTDLFKAKEAEV